MMKQRTIIGTGILMLILSLVSNPGWAAGGGGSGNSSSGSGGPAPVPEEIPRLIENEEYDRAIIELRSFVRKEKKNADAWNWLGYSLRKTGDFKNSLKSYKKALRIDKKHLGANEYLGELYVMQGDIKNANKQLKKLARYCDDCEQYQDLAQMIKNKGSENW